MQGTKHSDGLIKWF